MQVVVRAGNIVCVCVCLSVDMFLCNHHFLTYYVYVAHYYVTLGALNLSLSLSIFYFLSRLKIVARLTWLKEKRKKKKNIVLAFLKAACPWNPYWVHFIFKGPKSNKYV